MQRVISETTPHLPAIGMVSSFKGNTIVKQCSKIAAKTSKNPNNN